MRQSVRISSIKIQLTGFSDNIRNVYNAVSLNHPIYDILCKKNKKLLHKKCKNRIILKNVKNYLKK